MERCGVATLEKTRKTFPLQDWIMVVVVNLNDDRGRRILFGAIGNWRLGTRAHRDRRENVVECGFSAGTKINDATMDI